MDFTTTLRTIDAAGLDTYQYRLLMHIWRVGICWKVFETLANDTNMSIGKVHEARKQLFEMGWLEWCDSGNGKPAYRLNEAKVYELASKRGKIDPLPDDNISLHEEFSPHENNSYNGEEFSPHETKINNIKNNNSDLAKLRRIFTEETGYVPPNNPQSTEFNWDRPMKAIYEKAGSDYEKTQKAVEAGVRLLVKKRYTISSPKSIQSAAINWLNGVRAKDSQDHYGQYWKEIEQELKTNGRRSKRNWNGRIAPALKKAGGYKRLCSMTLPDAEKVFSQAFQDLERTSA